MSKHPSVLTPKKATQSVKTPKFHFKEKKHSCFENLGVSPLWVVFLGVKTDRCFDIRCFEV